jgi:hypothetical protein
MSIAIGAGSGAFIAFRTMQFAHEEHPLPEVHKYTPGYSHSTISVKFFAFVFCVHDDP